MRRALASFAAAATLVLAVPTPLPAQETAGLSASPSLGQVSTDAGRMVQDTVTVVNLSDEAMSVSATLAPLEVDPNGRFISPATSDLPSAVPWGGVEPSVFQLPAQNSRRVTATMTPPSGTPAGGYYAALRLIGTPTSGDSVQVIHPILIQVAGDGILTRRGRLVGVTIPSPSVRSSIPVKLTLENTGNVHVIAAGRITILDALSRVTATVLVARTPVLPGRTRILTVDVPAPLIPGSVTARANIAFGRGSSEVVATASGYSAPWWGILAIAIVVFLLLRVVLAAVRWRRRRRARREPEVGLPPEIDVDRAEAEEAAEVVPGPVADADAWRDAWEMEPIPRKRDLEPEEEIEELPTEAYEPHRVADLDEEEEPVPVASGGVLDLSEVLPGELELEEEAEPEPEEEAEPELEVEPLPVSLPVFKDLEGLGEPEPELEPEPEPELEPEPEPELEPEPEPEPVMAAPARGFPRGAAVRRARVALDLLRADAKVSDAKLDVGLEILRSVREHDEVRATVAAAFDEQRGGRAGQALEALTLALDAVGSDKALGALLEAYGSSKSPLAERLKGAIAGYGPDALRANKDQISMLPKKRREELGLS
ncbi:MAG: hypothetical protein WEB06_08615 [Actinomycetota bacterium]